MTQEELNKIIENHQHWLNEDCEGWENMRANLSYSDLSDSDLSGSDLSGANLSYSDLSGSDLSGANLSHSDLSYSDLSGANLSHSDLSDSDLSYSDLSGANLSHSDLSHSDLSGSDLSHSDLSGSNLSYSDLSDSDLSGSDLSGANLSHSDLSGSDLSESKHNEYTAFYDLQCPEDGDFIAYKKASNKIVKLRIPAEARRSSATTRKCRAEFADVLEILNLDKSKANVTEIPSNYNNEVIYKVGERVTADSWDDDRWTECSHGIHFFITFAEAVNY